MSEADFLATHGWAKATKTPLAGDASSRRYTRLTTPDRNAILMDEGPQSQPQLDRFAIIARHLTSLGLSAPKILAEGSDQFLLIEDLGDDLFAQAMKAEPPIEGTLYQAAIDALIVSQQAPVPDYIDPYGPTEMAAAVGLAFEWYPTPTTQYSQHVVSQLVALFQDLLSTHLTSEPVLIQRDFHAENLIWLPNRNGPARVGLLDFQDAVSGDPAYDLASLLVDARRDVSSEMKRNMIDYYATTTQIDRSNFEVAFHLCSAQRNLRILGIFSRLAIREGKPGYVDLIPRVWRNLMADIDHPVLSELKAALTILPNPDDTVLQAIRAAHA